MIRSPKCRIISMIGGVKRLGYSTPDKYVFYFANGSYLDARRGQIFKGRGFRHGKGIIAAVGGALEIARLANIWPGNYSDVLTEYDNLTLD